MEPNPPPSSLIHSSRAQLDSSSVSLPDLHTASGQAPPVIPLPLNESSRVISTEEETKYSKRLQSFSELNPAEPEGQIKEEISSSSSSGDIQELQPEKEIVEASQTHLGMQSVSRKIEKLPVFLWEYKEVPSQSTKKSIKIYTLTWNMFGKAPPDDISILFPKRSGHHIYIVCTQECLRSIGSSLFYSSKKTWELKLQETLGLNYYLFAANTLGATHVAVFAHFSLKNLLSEPTLQKVSTGFGNVVRNKGAVSVKFLVGSTSVLVVGCHLASGQGKVVSRNNDFRRIEKELFKDISTEPASELFDICIYLGDLNYRINGRKQDVELLIDLDIMEPLRKGDQLVKELVQNTLFSGFQEGALAFNPTYRYDVNSSHYDTSKKQRIPSWTDRIIYKSKGFKLLQKNYNTLASIRTSDHRPVFSQFKMRYEDKVEPVKAASGSKTCQVF